ncbi:MAG: DUF3298 domain-containing protein [Clostridiales bacterium]|nr:DUF3298 domain-containing protein [Candidatus Cacconaster stercorequi]
MKKISIASILMALCLLLAGCSTQGTATAPESGVAIPQKDDWTYELSTRQETGTAKAEDGRLLARYSYEIPEMTVYRIDGTPINTEKETGAAVDAAAAFNGYFADWLESQLAWFDEVSETARQDYAARGKEKNSLWNQADFAYTDNMTASFWHNDHMATVTLRQNSFTGGAHGYAIRTAANFDMSTGKSITIAAMTGNSNGLQTAVEQELLRQAAERAAQSDSVYFAGYEDTVKDWMERDIFFDDCGMTVVFAVYDIASYADGEQAFTIPYDTIAPYLNNYGRTMLELGA